jgi:hypothetical protein
LVLVLSGLVLILFEGGGDIMRGLKFLITTPYGVFVVVLSIGWGMNLFLPEWLAIFTHTSRASERKYRVI